MGVPLYNIRPEQVLATSNALLNQSNKIDTELDQLDLDVKGYMAEWEANDRDAYNAYKIKWDGVMKDLTNIINTRAVPGLTNMVTNITTTESNNIKLW
jgi:hypothetical protein